MIRAFLCILVFTLTQAANAADGALDKLQGKWQTTRTTEDGQKITQTIELKKNKLTFEIMDPSGSTVLVATADVKAQQAGAFDTFTITNLKAGRDEDSLETVEGERSYVYMAGYQTLTIVSNMDEERDDAPQIDVYKKVNASK